MEEKTCPKCGSNNLSFQILHVNKRKPYGFKNFFYSLLNAPNGMQIFLFIPLIGWAILIIIYARGYKVTEEEWLICQHCGYRERI